MTIRFLLAFAVALHRIATKFRIAIIEAETIEGYAAAQAAFRRRHLAKVVLIQAQQAVDELRGECAALDCLSLQLDKSNAQTIRDLQLTAL